MPSSRVNVWPNSGWFRTATCVPEMGVPSPLRTRPRSTATRVISMVPGMTPVWMGSAPVYRNSVDEAMSVGTLGSTGGATVAGSGGNPDV